MKLFSASLICLLLTSNQAKADNFDKILIGSTIADGLTTELALRRPNTYETNPLLANPYARIGIKGSMAALTIGIRHEMIKNNHKKTANIITGILVGFYITAAVNNYKMMRKY